LTLVHGGDELAERRGGGEVAAQQVGDLLVARSGGEVVGPLVAERVDPEIDRRGPALGCRGDVVVHLVVHRVGAGDRQGAGWAFLARAARRSWTPLVSESLISWSLSLEMKRWTRFSNRNRRMGLKAW